MKANIIANFSAEEKQAWEQFTSQRIKQLIHQFPEMTKDELESKVWLEFLCNKYSISSQNPFNISPIFYPFATRDFGPDTRILLNSFNHPTVGPILDPNANNLKLIASMKINHSKRTKPLSLYNFFFKRQQSEIKNRFPHFTIQEISRTAGQEWRAMSQNEKAELTKEYYAQFGKKPP